MLRLARERDHLRVVADQWGAPTPARLLAELTSLLLAKLGPANNDGWPRGEIFHASCAGVTTWHGFASMVIARDARLRDVRPPQIDAIATVDYPTPAARPANSVLDNRKLHARFALSLPSWETALALCFDPASSLPA